MNKDSLSINYSRIIKGLLKRIAPILPDELYLSLMYRYTFGKRLDLVRPRTFNEKLQWLKLYYRKPEMTTMVDKYAVKQYVASIIGDEYLIPTIGHWKSPEEISYDELPQAFVLKTTNGGGGGGVALCPDKNSFDFQAAQVKLRKSLATDIYVRLREWPYKNVNKGIIAEPFITDKTGELRDYKFFCFNGHVAFFKVDFNRFIAHRANYYSTSNKLLSFGEECCPPDYHIILEIPENIQEMIVLAERLSADFPFVRVDLYNVDGRIYFGEMTFFPASGFGRFIPDEADYSIGDLLVLPERI